MYNNNLPQQTPAYYYMPRAQMEAPSQPMMNTFVPQLNYIKGRPVVSIDEAKASQIDLDGSLFVFPDLGNKKIYTKQINLDGTATFNIYELATPVEVAPQPIYVTKDELDKILAQFKETLTPVSAPEPTEAH